MSQDAVVAVAPSPAEYLSARRVSTSPRCASACGCVATVSRCGWSSGCAAGGAVATRGEDTRCGRIRSP